MIPPAIVTISLSMARLSAKELRARFSHRQRVTVKGKKSRMAVKLSR